MTAEANGPCWLYQVRLYFVKWTWRTQVVAHDEEEAHRLAVAQLSRSMTRGERLSYGKILKAGITKGPRAGSEDS